MSDVTVYVWDAKYKSSILSLIEGALTQKAPSQKEVGHAALLIDDTYVSVYPPDDSSSPQAHPHASPEDEIAEEGAPSFVRTIDWLNTEEMLLSWERMAQDRYQVNWASCSGICENLIVKGAELSEVSRAFFPDAYAWFVEYMTDPSQAGNKEHQYQIEHNYPKNHVFGYLARRYRSSNPNSLFESIGITIRVKLASFFSNIEHGRTPSDLILTSKILTSEAAKELVQRLDS